MARIRSVHPGLWTDEAFVALSPFARLLAIGIWTECDDQGLFAWKPLQLKMRLMPADSVDIAALLAELLDGGLIGRFTVGKADLGAVRNFRKFQRPERPNAVHPITADIAAFIGLESTTHTGSAKKAPRYGGDPQREGDDATPTVREGSPTSQGAVGEQSPQSDDHSATDHQHGGDPSAEAPRGDTDQSEVEHRAITDQSEGEHEAITDQSERDQRPLTDDSPTDHRKSGQMEDGEERKGEKRDSPSLRSGDARARAPTARGTRLPADWEPSEIEADFALQLGLDAERVAARFRDYWHSKPGQAGVKCDWTATWRNWCREEADRGRGGLRGMPPGGPMPPEGPMTRLAREARARRGDGVGPIIEGLQ